MATQPVPTIYNLGHKSICSTEVTAIAVDEEDQHTMSATEPANQCTMFAGMATQTATETAAAAITLGDSQDVQDAKGQAKTFLTKSGEGDGNTPSRPPAGGHIPCQGGGGGGGSGSGGGGGGGGGSGAGRGTAAGNQGGGGKLSSNPPSEFNGDHALADTFINKFNLYCIVTARLTHPSHGGAYMVEGHFPLGSDWLIIAPEPCTFIHRHGL